LFSSIGWDWGCKDVFVVSIVFGVRGFVLSRDTDGHVRVGLFGVLSVCMGVLPCILDVCAGWLC
jgi:hypothetical protein